MNPEKIGPYRILEKLGAGGMGNVYLGRHEESGQMAAVKVLSASLAREAGFVERFNREVDAMHKLENPHIVQFYESGVDGENYFYAMEYVAGETLMSIIQRERRIPWRRALEIAIQVCQALKAAHDSGIIHRDLKPSNLMVATDGTVKLTDFGVAQVFASQRLTVTGGIIGTAEYMSPEQAQGKRASKQSDLYSLGAMLYTIITGRVPFSGKTMVEVIQKHKFGLFDRPRLIVPELPIRVEETICRLLEKEPDKRFPDALVLMRHLNQLLQADEPASVGLTLTDYSPPGDPCAPTVAAVPGRTAAESDSSTPQPGPATLMQRLLRAELSESAAEHGLSRVFNSTLFHVVALVLIVAGGAWWWRSRQLTPEQMFEAGAALMEQDAGTEWLRARREYFDPLVKADPATWQDRVAPFLKQIEFYELTRPARGGKLAAKKTVASEPERLLQLAVEYERLGDLVRAERILTGLTALLGDDAEQQKMREHAEQLLNQITKQRGENGARNSFVEQSAERARKLTRDGRAADARAVWQAIIAIYADDQQAAAIVSEARAALESKSPTVE